MKSRLLTWFKIARKLEEDVHDAIAARLDPSDILGSLMKLDALYRRVGFNHSASFGVLRKALADIPEMAQFVMYRAPDDYE